MTDILLAAILLAALARLYQAHRHQAQLIRWLDALAEMTGDQLRALIDKKGPKL